MTQTLSLHMGDTILVREQFQEAIVRIAELEKEVEATRQNANHWMERKEAIQRLADKDHDDATRTANENIKLHRALSESERISKSWKVQWEALLQDERKEKALRCSLQDSLSDIKGACSSNNTVLVEYYSRREKFLVRLIQSCYEIASEALKK